MLKSRKKYLAAVSGGPDSMAMLNKYKNKILVVCHVNYHKRKDSNYDQVLVEKYCKQKNIKLEILSVDELDYSNIKNSNFQSKAREIRYDFFAKVAKKYNTYNILIAHNLDDSLETAYMQFNRKSKSLFYGIKKQNKINSLLVYRPLLNFRKNDLKKYCEKKHIEYAIDYTNDLPIYERNKARKIISSWNKNQLKEFIKKVKKYNKTNKQLLKKINSTYIKWEKGKFNIFLFNKQNSKIKYYILYYYLNNHRIGNLSKNKINQIIKFLSLKKEKVSFRLANNKYLSIKDNLLTI